MEVIKSIIEKIKNKAIRRLSYSFLLFVGILYAEKHLYPESKILSQMNVLGRTSVIILFLIIIIFIAFERRQIFNIRDFKIDLKGFLIYFPLHLIAFTLFYYFKKIIISNPALIQDYKYWILGARYILPLLAVLFLFFALFSFKFIRNYKKSIAISFILAISFFQISMFFKQYWELFARMTTDAVAFLLKLSFDDVVVRYQAGGPLLGAKNFTALIQNPCSGIEGLSLFLFLFLLIVIIDRKEISWPKAIVAGIIGLIGMFVVNIIRIYLLYLVGIFYDPRAAVTYFHTNIGWFLFITYFVIYWLITYLLIRKK
jgi:exosortase/archaeosortase family protein